MPSLHGENRGERWENSRGDQRKPETQSRGLPAQEFSQNYIKLLFSVLTKRTEDYIRSVYMYSLCSFMNCKFSQLGDCLSYCSSFSWLVALWKHTSTCRPIKTHVLTKLFYKYHYSIVYYIMINSPFLNRFLKKLSFWILKRLPLTAMT